MLSGGAIMKCAALSEEMEGQLKWTLIPKEVLSK